MKIIAFCQTLDLKDQALSDTFSRISELANIEDVNQLFIVSLNSSGEQPKNIPSNVKIYSTKQRYKLFKLFELYKLVIPILLKNKINFCYVYMGNIFPIILLPLKLFFKFKIITWYGHLSKNILSLISLKYFTNIWLSSDDVYNIYNLKNFINIGHGVDKKKFFSFNDYQKRSNSLVCVGRISKIKNINLLIESIYLLKKINNINLKLIIIGAPYLNDDHIYKTYLLELIKTLKLQKNIEFLGHLSLSQINEVYNKYKFYITACPGGLGKSGIEGIHSGCVPIIAEPKLSTFDYSDILKKHTICKRISYDIYKKIYKLHTNEVLCKNILKNLEPIKNNFTYNNLMKNVINAYKAKHL